MKVNKLTCTIQNRLNTLLEVTNQKFNNEILSEKKGDILIKFIDKENNQNYFTAHIINCQTDPCICIEYNSIESPKLDLEILNDLQKQLESILYYDLIVTIEDLSKEIFTKEQLQKLDELCIEQGIRIDDLVDETEEVDRILDEE